MHRIVILVLVCVWAFPVLMYGDDKGADRLKVIFETDIGNDIDDALAMDMLYKYIDSGAIDVLAIMINKNGDAPAGYVDLMNVWYGHRDIPIGVIRNGADCENDAVNYAELVCGMTDKHGEPLFMRSLKTYRELPDAHRLYRKVLSEQPDSSVTIVSVGFFTNLSRLLDTRPDEYSSMSGMELVSSKVCSLVVMAGCFNDPDRRSYNVFKDIDAAEKVISEWPGEIIATPYEVGAEILFPSACIEQNLNLDIPHPVVEAYKVYRTMPYDRPTWDLTALMYVVEDLGLYSISGPGRISISPQGVTFFEPDDDGSHYYLMTDEVSNGRIRDYFIRMISRIPQKFNIY